VDLIRALEKQIEEGNGDTIGLKRTRNSLLNISARVPPEILGGIFAWCLVRETDRSFYPSSHFVGLQKGSYNFLLVCHHWFEVASRTPELWSFWGNTLRDWKRFHGRSGAAPIDLVLDGDRRDDLFDEPLRDAVRSRVMQGAIRQVHLRSNDCGILTSIISSLTPDDNSTQNENIESIVLGNGGFPSVDVSDFFIRSHLSKLRFLDLSGDFQFSSWDPLASRTTLLTTLDLSIHTTSIPTSAQLPTLTAAQLFSILTSNPGLQKLLLFDAALPDVADWSTSKVPLFDLKELSLSGQFRHLFGLLHRLMLPETLDELHLNGFNPTIEEILQTLVPYIRDYFTRDARFQDRPGFFTLFAPGSASISVNAAHDQTTAPQNPPCVIFSIALAVIPPPDVLGQLFIDLIAPTPREYVVFLDTNLDIKLSEELFLMMPSIETLRLSDAELSEGFLQPNPDGPHANRKLFPSLRSLYLEHVNLDDNNWDHLITYLAHQTSDGQIVSLEVLGDSPYMPPDVVDEVAGLVEEFTYHQNQEVDVRGSPLTCGYPTHEEDE